MDCGDCHLTKIALQWKRLAEVVNLTYMYVAYILIMRKLLP